MLQQDQRLKYYQLHVEDPILLNGLFGQIFDEESLEKQCNWCPGCLADSNLEEQKYLIK